MAFKLRNPFYFDLGKKAALNQSNDTEYNKYFAAISTFLRGLQPGVTDQKKIIEMSYRANANVYSVIELITNRSSQLMWTVYEIKDKKDSYRAKAEYEAYQKSGDIFNALKTKAKYYEVSKNKQLNDLILRPNKLQSMPVFVKEALGYKLLTGNRYLYKLKPSGFKTASQLFILPSHFMQVKLKDGANYLTRDNVEYLFDQGYNIPFSSDEICHSKSWNPFMIISDSLYGFSPITAAYPLIQKNNSSYTASRNAYDNMGISGILSQGPVAGEDGGFMSKTEAEAIQKKMDKKMAGVDNFKKVIITSAAVSWQNMGLSPVDLAIIDAQKMDREEIANIYSTPVQMLNSQEASTRDNMLTAERSFYLNAVIPHMNELRDDLNYSVASDFGDNFYIDYDTKSIPALQSDLKTLSERLVAERKIGVISTNEYRAIMDYEPAQPNQDPDKKADLLEPIKTGKEETEPKP
jgi:HK97 family phage portal protein